MMLDRVSTHTVGRTLGRDPCKRKTNPRLIATQGAGDFFRSFERGLAGCIEAHLLLSGGKERHRQYRLGGAAAVEQRKTNIGNPLQSFAGHHLVAARANFLGAQDQSFRFIGGSAAAEIVEDPFPDRRALKGDEKSAGGRGHCGVLRADTKPETERCGTVDLRNDADISFVENGDVHGLVCHDRSRVHQRRRHVDQPRQWRIKMRKFVHPVRQKVAVFAEATLDEVTPLQDHDDTVNLLHGPAEKLGDFTLGDAMRETSQKLEYVQPLFKRRRAIGLLFRLIGSGSSGFVLRRRAGF